MEKVIENMCSESSMGKVVVRTLDGKVHRGFSRKEDISEDTVKIISRNGKKASFPIAEVKGVFFVKDFEGNPDYDPVKFLDKEKGRSYLIVRVEFVDGENVEGTVADHMALLLSPGFYLWPSDENTNNGLVYVVKKAIRNFDILGIH
jgi:hypothetical protein